MKLTKFSMKVKKVRDTVHDFISTDFDILKDIPTPSA